ncbi:cytochrome P450 family 8 subfamily B member 1, gene 1 S homeolog [Xenopus laevis]|uniref:Cytochrome P450 family 8 subfamily B member 1, gene 1 S homeolog n=1 Tax=Xenopus laevis TaxID=8355 RepID=Q7SYV8_XENLA|nr:cytochrome P450 family 8 subfamily B member 1, gene 1 S homeolog [Xenopus laevis]AAH54247.1 MGC64456 protein [Xenopus laevis]
MALFFPIILALLASVIGGLYLLGMFRKRRSDEPPLDKGTIPWLGYALDFRKSTSNFLQKMHKKHGDIFTVQIAGYYFTFVMDPLSFGPIIKESKANLDFEEFARELVSRVFGYQSVTHGHKMLEKSSTKHLMGDGLVVMTQAMMENLQNLMVHNIGSSKGEREWHQDGLFNYSYNVVFRAGYLALYGNEPAKNKGKEKAKEFDRTHSDELFYEFRKYDQLFPRLAYSVLPPKDKIEAERLKRLFWNMLSVKKTLQKENISGWIGEQHQQRAEQGMPEHMQDRFMFFAPVGISG